MQKKVSIDFTLASKKFMHKKNVNRGHSVHEGKLNGTSVNQAHSVTKGRLQKYCVNQVHSVNIGRLF